MHVFLFLSYILVGIIARTLAGLFGIGGGTISVPFLTWQGIPVKQAIGISADIYVINHFYSELKKAQGAGLGVVQYFD